MSKMKTFAMFGLLLCSLLFSASALHAQVTDTVRTEQPPAVEDSNYTEDEVDTTATTENTEITDTLLLVNHWVYPADSLKKLQREKDFAYVKNLDSLLIAWQDEYLKNQKELEPVETEPRGEVFPIVRILLWMIAIAVVLFIIYSLFLSERGLFAAPTRNKTLQVEEEPVKDEEYLERQLKDAVRKGNYRLAIRYLYLQTLSKLSDKGWLHLSPDKTNYQYVRELSKPQYRNEFARITLHYEYAWYGDFTIKEDIFKPVQEEFDQFQLKLKQN